MEFLLLWWDNLDDSLCAARHLAPKILGFLLAFALFALTGFALLLAPQATLAVIGLMLSASLYDHMRRKRTLTAER
jgi:hypothetical protein